MATNPIGTGTVNVTANLSVTEAQELGRITYDCGYRSRSELIREAIREKVQVLREQLRDKRQLVMEFAALVVLTLTLSYGALPTLSDEIRRPRDGMRSSVRNVVGRRVECML
jgi:metal-responsive CopG/Arc/MetJ family transcriptional regulator